MTFKEQLAADAAAFINPAEFADPITLDGQALSGMIEPVAYQPAVHGPEGYNIERQRLHLVAAQVAGSYVPGQQADVGGAIWEVEDVDASGEVLVLSLMRYRS